MSIEIQQLRCFALFGKNLNYTQTAKELFLTRQAVSKAIHSIESELDIVLVDKDGAKLMLTPSGRRFAYLSDKILSDYDSLINEFNQRNRNLNAIEAQMKTLDIVFSPTLATATPGLFEYLAQFNSSNISGIYVGLSQGTPFECYKKVMDEEADGAFIVCMQRSFPKCRQIPLGFDRMVPLVLMSERNSLAHKGEVTLRDLENLDLVLLSDFDFVYRQLIDECATLGIDLSPKDLIDEYATAAGIVRYSDTKAMIVSHKSSKEWEEHLTAVPLRCEKLRWYSYFIYRKDSKKVSALSVLESQIQDFISKTA